MLLPLFVSRSYIVHSSTVLAELHCYLCFISGVVTQFLHSVLNFCYFTCVDMLVQAITHNIQCTPT